MRSKRFDAEKLLRSTTPDAGPGHFGNFQRRALLSERERFGKGLTQTPTEEDRDYMKSALVESVQMADDAVVAADRRRLWRSLVEIARCQSPACSKYSLFRFRRS